MQKIAFMAPNKERLQRIQALLKDYEDEVLFDVGSLDSGIAKAKELVDQELRSLSPAVKQPLIFRTLFPRLLSWMFRFPDLTWRYRWKRRGNMANGWP